MKDLTSAGSFKEGDNGRDSDKLNVEMPATPPTIAKHARKSPTRRRPYVWSIGIFTGDSPLRLISPPEVENPVLRADDVSDVSCPFVADPFMLEVNGVWHMFFEVMNSDNDRGEIGHAVSTDAFSWEYQKIVLAEPFHLSYPYVFEHEGAHYMIPESLGARSVGLYRADSFPEKWSLATTLITGEFADPSICYFENRWWLFVCATPFHHDTLHVYFADNLWGAWMAHPLNPIINGNHSIARPGGRVLVLDDKVIRFAQDCHPIYGTQVRAFEISSLTPTDYREREVVGSPVLKGSGIGWNKSGMHTIDPHLTRAGYWIACVDGVIR